MSIKAIPIHIAGICGSMRGPESYTRKLLVTVMTALQATGATTDMLDLADMALPMCKGPGDTDDNPATLDLRHRIRTAQGIVLATPEYHNSFSGVLKNALDLLHSEQTANRMFGLIGIAGGAQGAVNALGHLRTVVRGIGGFCIPHQIILPSVYRYFDGACLTDRDVQERIDDFARALVTHARALAQVQAADGQAE